MAYWPDEDPTGRYLIDDVPGVSPRGIPGTGGRTTTVGGPGFIQKQKKKSFQDKINADPIYAMLRDNLAAQGIVDAGTRRSAIQRALINFGLVPDFARAGLSGDALGFLGTDVDAATRSQANNMTGQGLSFLARLNKADSDARIDLKNELAAKGILESGATGYGLNEQAGKYKTSLFDAEQQLFDTLMGYIGTFVEGERARQQQLLEGLAEAGDRAAEEEPEEEPDLDGTPAPQKKKSSSPQSLGKAGPNKPGRPRDLVPSEGGAKGGATKTLRKKRPKPKPNTNSAGQRIGGV